MSGRVETNVEKTEIDEQERARLEEATEGDR